MEDASRRDIFDFTDLLTSIPVRYGALAVAARRLYAGTRTSLTSRPPYTGGDVITSSDGETWSFSNEPGFGETNDTVTTLASVDAYLYAGTLNPDGFQVWRRTPDMGEVLPFLFQHLKIMNSIRAGFRRCVPFGPLCDPDFLELYAQLDLIQLGFERAQIDDPLLLQTAMTNLGMAKNELDVSQALVGEANKQQSIGEAQKLRSEALLHINNAIDLVEKTLLIAQQSI